MITAAALLASAWVIVAYFYTSTTGRTRPFHLANAVGSVPLATAAVLAGAWGSVPLTVLFGLTGCWGLWRGHRLGVEARRDQRTWGERRDRLIAEGAREERRRNG